MDDGQGPQYRQHHWHRHHHHQHHQHHRYHQNSSISKSMKNWITLFLLQGGASWSRLLHCFVKVFMMMMTMIVIMMIMMMTLILMMMYQYDDGEQGCLTSEYQKFFCKLLGLSNQPLNFDGISRICDICFLYFGAIVEFQPTCPSGINSSLFKHCLLLILFRRCQKPQSRNFPLTPLTFPLIYTLVFWKCL